MSLVDQLHELSDEGLKYTAEQIRQIQVSRKFLKNHKMAAVSQEGIRVIESWFILNKMPKWAVSNLEKAWKEITRNQS